MCACRAASSCVRKNPSKNVSKHCYGFVVVASTIDEARIKPMVWPRGGPVMFQACHSLVQ